MKYLILLFSCCVIVVNGEWKLMWSPEADKDGNNYSHILNEIEQNTVKPVYNSVGYNELPLITKHIVFADCIDFFIN